LVAVTLNIRVVNFTAVLENTAQWETKRALLPAKKKALANPDNPSANSYIDSGENHLFLIGKYIDNFKWMA
jgi:hypothetical protein